MRVGKPIWSTVVAALSVCLATCGTTAAVDLAEQGASYIEYLRAFERAFNDVYEQVSPAVVLVTTTRNWQPRGLRLPRFHPSLPDDEEPTGIGSGAIISPDGYLLSNYHVIKDADSIAVTLSDRRTFDAEVVGFDSLIDIAVLKIPAEDLPIVRLGDSDRLKIGDLVLAIGHPLGLGITLTDGIVSALGRQATGVIDGDYAIESFIQTNAVINKGNSGGPLIALNGDVVGINTAISTRTEFYIGYGLAVPINLAREAIDDILTHGRVVRSYLGVEMLEVDHGLVQNENLSLEVPRGVYIARTAADSPAELGGIRGGDVILSIDGVPVTRRNQIQTIIYNRDPGSVLTLEVLRGGEKLGLTVTLREREEDRLLARGRERISRLGITVKTLSPEAAAEVGFTDAIAAELGFGADQQIVVVTAVEPEGAAAAKGIRIHDVITEIDQHRITSVQEFARFISRLDRDKAALFWFWRQNQGIDVRALRIMD